jgi:hypothetical protein
VNHAKFSFKPTQNLEFGFSLRTIWGGPGFPITAQTFLRTLDIFRLPIPGAPKDPGDGDSGFDFRYRIPGLRDWLTLYADSMSDDEFSPIAYPRRSAFRAGIYMPRIPAIPKLDFRAEGVYTDLPNFNGSGFYYWNFRYVSGVTNRGNIIGDWIGREGSGFKAATTYWFDAKNTLQLSYRNVNVNPNFIGGGNYDDFAGHVDWEINPKFSVSVSSQYERWRFPLLDVSKHSNVTSSITVNFKPVLSLSHLRN